jgi:hypothetical protein
LSLRDPADETNDLGRKALAIKHLRETLKHSVKKEFYKRLLRNKETSLLHPLVTPVYGLTIDKRKKLSEQGLKVSRDLDTSLARKAKQIREALASADSEPPKLIVPLEPAEPDNKSKAQATNPSASPSVQEGAGDARIKYIARPFNPEGALKVAEGYVELREKLPKRGVQLPSIARASQDFRSKSASETQRNYESRKRKHENALKRSIEAKGKPGKTVELQAVPEVQVAESQEVVTAQLETGSSHAMKTESEGAATPVSELPIEQVETKAEEVTEPTSVEAAGPNLVEDAEPTSVQAVEPTPVEAIETVPAELRESRLEEVVKPTLGDARQTK